MITAGTKFGDWTVLEVHPKTALCRCTCGKIREVYKHNLHGKKSLSCGCKRVPSNKLDLTGQRFGRLKVVRFSHSEKDRAFWACHCDCGNDHIVNTTDLRRGATKSCGCLRKDLLRKPYGEQTRNSMMLGVLFAVYRCSARDRGHEFNLSKDDFLTLTGMSCHYCGAPPSNTQKSICGMGDYIYSGLDLVDNSKGYILGNVVPCCETCNKAKRELTLDDFMKWISRLHLHQLREAA